MTLPLGGLARFSSGGGGGSPVLTLSADPTLTPTAGDLGQFGLFGGQLYQHLTADTDILWTDVECPGEPVQHSPDYVPEGGLQRPIGSVAVIRTATPGGGYAFLKAGLSDLEWVSFNKLLVLVRAAGWNFSSVNEVGMVLVKEYDVAFGDFATIGEAQTGTIDLAPLQTMGASESLLVAARAHTVTPFAFVGDPPFTTAVATVGDLGVVDSLVGSLDVKDAAAGKSGGALAEGRNVVIPQVTLTIFGEGLDMTSLTAGLLRVTVEYRLVW